MALADKTLTCKDCGSSFTFTVGEQEFYKSRGLQNEPGRCSECRAAKRQSRYRGGYGEPRTMHQATCAKCGAECEVPFEPTNDRPIYCSTCYAEMKQSSSE
ncbi:MAG: zinc-ribbon domain containing protein [Chloroflexi bacterium]|nr:zinc-ribbon domain containing protein [Chloroflexota bacterium]